MNKRLFAHDFSDMRDLSQLKGFHSNPRTEIIFRDPVKKEVLFKAHNKVVGAG